MKRTHGFSFNIRILAHDAYYTALLKKTPIDVSSKAT